MDRPLVIGILLFVGAAQGILLSAVLFTMSRGNRVANRIMGVLLSLFSLMIIFHTIGELRGEVADKASHIHYGQTVFALFGPLIYFYALAMTTPGFRLRSNDAFHLIPFGILVLVSVAPLNPSDRLSWQSAINFVAPWIFIVQMTLYLYAVLRLLKEHQKTIRESFSSLRWVNLRWLYFLTIAQLIIWPVAFLSEVMGSGSRSWDAVWLLISVFIYAMGYFGLRQPEILTGVPELAPETSSRKKYERSTLSTTEADDIAIRLRTLMDSEKVYLDADLSLPNLAKRLAVSTHHVSQVLNERIGENFFEYVNRFRVEEAKRLLQDPAQDHLSIAGIGYEAGFNSLSAFNTVFKKLTGTTPSQCRLARK